MKLYGGSGKRSSKKNQTNTPQGREPKGNQNDRADTRSYDEGSGAENAKPKKKGRAGKIVLSIFLVLLALVVGVFAYWKITTRPPDTLPEAPDPGAEAEEPDEPFNVERYYTILIVGDDQEGGNTDTIMAMRFDTQELTANVVSIPRDTALNIALENKKINAVYHNMGGMDALLDEVDRIAGFRPNNYIMVDMEVFIDVVDALGGVDFDVPVDMKHDEWQPDGKGGIKYEFHIDLRPGMQPLTGYEALGVFRFRMNNDGTGYAMGDIDRLATQHDLMMAIAGKAMSTKNPITLFNIAKSVLDKCDTDLTLPNVQWYIQEFMKMSLENISFQTAPTDNCMVFGASYVTLQADAWVEMVNSKLMPYEKTVTKEDLAIFNFSDGYIDNRGYRIVKQEDFFCTNGEEPYNKNFTRG